MHNYICNISENLFNTGNINICIDFKHVMETIAIPGRHIQYDCMSINYQVSMIR